MAMIARSPVWGSWQNTTCSCPPRAAGTWAAASWGYTGAVPPRLLAKTFVTVVTLLGSSRVLVDADLASSVCPPPVVPRAHGRSAPAGPRRARAASRPRGVVMISLRVVSVSRDYCVPIFLGASLRGVPARLRALVGVPRGRRPALG